MGKKIDQLDVYDDVNTDKSRKNLFEVSKNTGTYSSPVYATDGSRKITQEQLREELNIKEYYIKDVVTINNGDTLELDKLNNIIISSNETFTLPTASISNVGKCIAIRHQGGYVATISGIAGGSIKLININESVLLQCVFDGVSTYDWFSISKSLDSKICSINVTLVSNTYTAKHNENIKADAQSIGSDVDVTIPTAGIEGRLIYVYYPSGSPSAYVVNLIGGFSATLVQTDFFLIRDNGSYWEAISSTQIGGGSTSDNITNNSTVSGATVTDALDALLTNDTTTLNSAKSYADSLVVGLWDDRGNFDASVNAYPSSGGSGTAGAIKKGDIWTISVAGTLPTSQVVEVGDTVRALVDTPGNTQANWSIQQNNIGYVPEKDTAVTTEVWGTNANYTITNTTAKVLVIEQNGTLTATRTLTLSTLPTGSILIIRGGASITAANVINITGFVNGISTYNSALTLAYQSLILYSLGSGNYTTNKPQFTETTTTVSTSKILRGVILGTNAQDGFPTLPNAGDFMNVWLNAFAYGIAMNMRGGSTSGFIKQYDAHLGWTQYANTGTNPNIKYWNGQEITSGNIPIGAYGGNESNTYRGWYKYEIYDSTGKSIRGFFHVDNVGIPSNLTQQQQETTGLSIAITGSPAKVVVTNANAIYARITLLETSSITPITKMPELYDAWSNDGLTKYWIGSGGFALGTTTIDASAQSQADATNKGSLIRNRVTTSQKTSISSPANGLNVYDTDLATDSTYTTKSSINAWIDSKLKYSELFDPCLMNGQVAPAGVAYAGKFKPKSDMIATQIEFFITNYVSTETFYCGIYDLAGNKLTDGSVSVTTAGDIRCNITNIKLTGATTYYLIVKDDGGGANSLGRCTSYGVASICSSKYIGSGALPATTSGFTVDTIMPFMAVISL